MALTSLKRLVEQNDTPGGRIFDLLVQGVILVSLVSFSIDTLPHLDSGTRRLLDVIEVATVVIFTAEYVARLVVADSRMRFVFSFYGIVDAVAILPFYLASGVDLRAICAFRLFRLLRAFKLLRYSTAAGRLLRALAIAREELILFFSTTLLLLCFSAVGIYYFENPAQPEAFSSVFDGLWWAVATLTTVGYGDIIPLTIGGRFFTFVVLMLGLGLVALPSGLIASAMSKVRNEPGDSPGAPISGNTQQGAAHGEFQD